MSPRSNSYMLVAVSMGLLSLQMAAAFASPATSIRSHAFGRQPPSISDFNAKHTGGLQMTMIPRGGAIASCIASKLALANKSPINLFNTALVTLALATASFKVIQKSQPKDASIVKKEKPAAVKSLQVRFLAVFWLLRCADWLQGPYFYEVYASKVFNGAQASLGLVSKLFLTGFASTALFGPLVGRASDVYGRKKGTLAFALLYAVGAISTKSPVLMVLMLGRVFSGVGTSLLFSAPESWLVGESQKNGEDPDGSYLGETFGLVSF
jgi:MFS transporter, MFS domain-containing protein family, molybdate-anion transporter